MNTQINITENGKTTLSTAGKYCDRNIDVNVEVDTFDADAFVQGTIEGELISDKVTNLRTGAFAECTNLTCVSLPNCTTMNYGTRTFYNCKSLSSVELPKLETITEGSYTFSGVRSIREINLPSLTKITSMTAFFQNCQNVRKIILPLLGGTTIGNTCFDNNYQLNTLVLGGDTLNPLDSTNAFRNAGSQTASGLSIYVPDNLVEAYKTATNWVSMADKIKPMSELEE